MMISLTKTTMKILFAFLAFEGLFLLVRGHEDPWGENVIPRLKVNYLTQTSDSVRSFIGNQTHNDHFKLLQSDGVSLLIGARNVVYNVSLNDLTENREQRITWTSLESDRNMCLVKGKSEDECQNYIRVLAQPDPSHLLVCGTNSFNPRCRTYSSIRSNKKSKNEIEDTDYEDYEDKNLPLFRPKHEFSGKGFCPYDPKHNSTAVFTDGELYSGTVADFSGSDPLIIRDRIRTEQYDLKHLNAPDFVGSMEDEDNVYFFFRENAVEYINCGKSVYSRVARVCKNDVGGPHKFKNKWTTFMKTRLNCSMPGSFPFYFNEIQSTTSNFVESPDGDRIIYGVFTTPDNAIAGSAICSFRLSDIQRSFNGDFKGQEDVNSNWLPVRSSGLPEPKIGTCEVDSKSLNEASLNFLKGHSLMDETVSNSQKAPLLVKTSMRERFTVIAVDPKVRTPGGALYDVLFVGTTTGKVVKFVSAINENHINGGQGTNKPVVIEEIQVFPYHVPVTNVQVIKETRSSEAKLIVLSDHEVKSLPLNRCNANQLQSCTACVALQDPYCAWNLQTGVCTDHRKGSGADASMLIQDVYSGRHAACSSSEASNLARMSKSASDIPKITVDDREYIEDAAENESEIIDVEIEVEPAPQMPIQIEGVPIIDASGSLYSSEQLTLASVLVAIFSLLIGFAFGFLTSRRCSKGDYTSCGHHYLETQRNINKHHDVALAHSESGYTPAPCNNALLSSSNATSTATTTTMASTNSSGDLAKNSNLLVNVPPKDEVGEKNNINTGGGTIGRTGTLCKKVYL